MRSQSFNDFDDFAESIRGVVSKMMLRNPAKHRWTLRAVDLEGIDVQVGQLGSGNIALGELQAGGTMLYLPLTLGVQYSANGSVLQKGSFAILEPGCEFCISTKVQHDWFAVRFPTHLLTSEERKVGTEIRRPTVRVSAINKKAAERFREIVAQVMAVAAKTNQIESGPAAASVSAELLKVAASVLPLPTSGKRQVGRPKVPREQIIARSHQHLEQHADDDVLVGDLAAAAGVSERTLRTAFNSYFGVGPVQYLQFRQLHQVHRSLRAAEPDQTTVSNVLVGHGVWEFSRFAARYRRVFGELPSGTLRSR